MDVKHYAVHIIENNTNKPKITVSEKDQEIRVKFGAQESEDDKAAYVQLAFKVRDTYQATGFTARSSIYTHDGVYAKLHDQLISISV